MEKSERHGGGRGEEGRGGRRKRCVSYEDAIVGGGVRGARDGKRQ